MALQTTYGGEMMIKLTFTEHDIAELKREKEYNPFPKVRRRCETVYVKSQGFQNKDVEKIVGISHSTVTNHLKLYQQGGIEALKTLNYKGQPSKLHQNTDQIKASFEAQPVGLLKKQEPELQRLPGLRYPCPRLSFFRPYWTETTQSQANPR